MRQFLDDLKKCREKDEYTFIYDGNGLTHLFYESKIAGYEPEVRFSRCIVPGLFLKLYIKKKSIKCRITTPKPSDELH